MEHEFELPTIPPTPVFDRSTLVGELMDALAKAQVSLTPLPRYRQQTRTTTRSMRTCATIIGAARPALAKHGIAFFHTP